MALGYTTKLLDKTETIYVSPGYIAKGFALYRRGAISRAKLAYFLEDVGRKLEDLELQDGPFEENTERYSQIAAKAIDEDWGPDPA